MCTNSPTGHQLLLHFKGQGMIWCSSYLDGRSVQQLLRGKGGNVRWGCGNLKHSRPVWGGVVGPQWHRFEEDNAYKLDHYWHSGRLLGSKNPQNNATTSSGNVAVGLRVYNSSIIIIASLMQGIWSLHWVFLAWFPNFLCECAGMQHFVWQSGILSLWKVPRICRQWELRRTSPSSNILRSDKRVWSLYRITNDSVMSLNTQKERYLEEERRKALALTHLQYNTTERAKLHLPVCLVWTAATLRWLSYWMCLHSIALRAPTFWHPPGLYFIFFLGNKLHLV